METNNLKIFVRGAYDLQKLRIQMGNRIVANFKARLGQKPSEKEDTIDEQGKVLLTQIRRSYKKITDKIKTFPRQSTFKGDQVISTFTELCLVAQYISLESQEASHFKRLGSMLNEYPIYSEFLKEVKGIGPAMAGVLISEIDIERCQYPSSLWKYAGLDVAEDGRGRSKKKEHLVTTKYVNKDGEDAIKLGITFNPWLKTKLVGVLASSFLRAGDNPYSQVYRDDKNRLENHPKHIEKTKGHRHNMAMRKMIKIFLIDLHIAWRGIAGLPVSASYCEGKLGKVHKAG